MTAHANVIARLIFFLLFVWLARSFFGLMEADGCLDDGGAVHDGICIESRHGQWALASERPFLTWVMSLGIPGLIVWVLYFYTSKAKRKSS